MYDRELDDIATGVDKVVEYADRLEAQGVDQITTDIEDGASCRLSGNHPARATESDDSVVHVHKVIESMPWWARAFTQHEGKTTNG